MANKKVFDMQNVGGYLEELTLLNSIKISKPLMKRYMISQERGERPERRQECGQNTK